MYAYTFLFVDCTARGNDWALIVITPPQDVLWKGYSKAAVVLLVCPSISLSVHVCAISCEHDRV